MIAAEKFKLFRIGLEGNLKGAKKYHLRLPNFKNSHQSPLHRLALEQFKLTAVSRLVT